MLIERARFRLFVAAVALGSSAPLGAQADRTILPVPPAPFTGEIKHFVQDSRASPLQQVRAPAEAPNIFLFMSDDAGFAMSSAFGGPIPTPNMDRLAAMGQRYNRFHTTGVCSPSRASLLTGRNHHNAHVGYLSDMPAGFPGYDAQIGQDTATIAQTLRLNGYNTAMIGKHHNTPPNERSIAGPFDMWPTGLGFEYFFGIASGGGDQWHPNIFRGTDLLPDLDGEPQLLDQRLATDAIRWIHNQKAAAPDKPFFMYYAPASPHSPHHAPAEVIDRFKGHFDKGWDEVRKDIFKRQLQMGVVPKGSGLTPRPDGIPAWSSLSPKQKAFASRSMEAAAAAVVYQDEQLGRVIAELERMGELEKTLIVLIQGDNGASSEGGPEGSINEIGHINGIPETEDWRFENVDKLGGPETFSNFPVGWGWAMNTPLRWTKTYASMLGSTRNGMIVSWQGHIASPNAVCSQFSHLIDIAPTLLEAAQLPAPKVVNGLAQKPLDGESLVTSLSQCEPDRPRTQYFEIMGKASLYHNGWFLSRDDDRLPWDGMPASGPKPPPLWSLYDLRSDFSQAHDIASRNPTKLEEMQQLWTEVATRNNVFPLDHRFGRTRAAGLHPHVRPQYDYWGKDVSIPAMSGPMFAGRSFTIDAQLRPSRHNSSGVILATGSHFGGFSLYLDKGRPTFTYAASTRPEHTVTIAATEPLVAGTERIRLRFTFHGRDTGATIELLSGNTSLASGHIVTMFPIAAGTGEMLDIGRDSGGPVTSYVKPHGKFEGDVPHVRITFP
ncbi:MAG: arylsulfatase [Novosphingobium sp.]|nr:arylsulfatase [Novosphingobium sp.]